MQNTFTNFFSLFKNICRDICFLYKNFFHWNASKILMLLASFIVGILLSLPFFLLVGILALIDPIDWTSLFSSDINIYMNIANYLAIHPIYILVEFIIFALGMIFLFLGISYHIVLESKLYLYYFENKRFFDRKKEHNIFYRTYRYSFIFGWALIYLFAPLIIFSFIFTPLFIIFTNIITSSNASIILLSCLSVFSFIWFGRILLKLLFSYFQFNEINFLDLDKKPRQYIKDALSFELKEIYPQLYTYFGILAWILFYLLLPVLTLFIAFILLFLCFKFLFLPEAILSGALFIVFVLCTIWFVYLSYRLTFSYLVFMDEDNYSSEKKSKSYIKKSFKITAGKVFFKFLGIFVLFAIILGPFNLVNVNLDNNIEDIKNYFGYRSGQLQINDEKDQGYYEYLQSVFAGVEDEEIISDLQKLHTIQIIYSLFFFLFIAGVFPMVLASFYRRALQMQWSKAKKEDKKTKKTAAKTSKKTKQTKEVKSKKSATKKRVVKKKTTKQK